MYPILENDRDYTDWIINIKRRFKSKRCKRVIDANFLDNIVVGDADVSLYKAQQNHMSIVLDQVLKTTNGMRLNRKHHDYPWEIWRLHELHQRSSATNKKTTTALSQELAKIKVVDFDHPRKSWTSSIPSSRNSIKSLPSICQ